MVNHIFLSGKKSSGLTAFILIVCLCQSFICTNGYCGNKTTSVSSITALKNLSKKNDFYTIGDTAQIDGNYYRFSLTTPHGEYDVLSIKDLLKVCNEIRIIEEFRATDEGEQAWNGAGESLKNIGRGAKQIVKNPKESAKAFKRAGGKLVRGVGRFFSKKLGKEEDSKTEDGTDRAEGGKGMFVGKQSRLFAAEVGLDVYTDNPYAKTLIAEVAEQRAKGSIGTSVGLFFLAPVAGLGLLSNSLTPDGFDAETENLISHESPAELRYLITEMYKNQLGIKSEKDNKVLASLIKNGNYTPREQAYIYFHLKRLTKPVKGNGIEGLMDAIKHLGSVKTPNDATFASTQLELLSAYQQHDKDLARFASTANMLGSINNNKQMFFIIPYDIANNSPETQRVLDRIGNAAESYGVKSTELWITGKALKGFIKKAKSKKARVKDNVLLLPHFAPAGSV
ncbi:MAG: hypothetical protein ACUZ8O_15350 [Candidatus Anammoxibacter sp.]